jgi:regulator of sigma E protease
MSLLLFFIVLVILVVVHEFGHFVVAKLSGMKVEEFGFGFPPRLFAKKKGETVYSFNALPFGGFVKILGESEVDIAERCLAGTVSQADLKRSFVAQKWWKQALVVVAGVVFNFLLAWLLMSIGFAVGMPVAAGDKAVANEALLVTSVLADSPAALAGLRTGDRIVSVFDGGATPELNEKSFQNFIAAHDGQEIGLVIARGGEEETIRVTPISGVIAEKPGIGISLALVGIKKLPPHLAVVEGFKETVLLTKQTATILATLIRDAFVGEAKLDSLTGPVGLVGVVGSAFALGFVHLVSLTALISVNLAIINLVPFPALDGGRLVVILLERLIGRRISPKAIGTANALGFIILIFLLILVTYNDIIRLF